MRAPQDKYRVEYAVTSGRWWNRVTTNQHVDCYPAKTEIVIANYISTELKAGYTIEFVKVWDDQGKLVKQLGRIRPSR